METSLRVPAAALLVVAILAAVVAQLPMLDFEAGTLGSATNREQVWTGSLTIPPADTEALPAEGTSPARSVTWFDDGLDERGLTQVRLGGPFIIFGLLVLAAAVVVVLGRRTLEGGLMGILGTLIVAVGLLLLVLGFAAMNRNLGDNARFRLGFGPAFYILIGSCVAGLVGGIFAVAEKRATNAAGDAVAAAQRPVLSTENPKAFDPMASKDPKAFKPDPPRDYKEMKVKDGRGAQVAQDEAVIGEDDPYPPQ